MYKYLNKDYKTVEELKKHYRELSKKYHPDINNEGLETMQKINLEFEKLFNIINTTEEKAVEFMDIINNIINLDITIEIVGSWIWVSGKTYEHKEILKENGFKWASKKKQWYYNPIKGYKKRSKKSLSYEKIKSIYGYETVKKANNIGSIA